MAKVKMYGQKRLTKLPNNPRDLRYLQRQRNREKQTPEPVDGAAQWRKRRKKE